MKLSQNFDSSIMKGVSRRVDMRETFSRILSFPRQSSYPLTTTVTLVPFRNLCFEGKELMMRPSVNFRDIRDF